VIVVRTGENASYNEYMSRLDEVWIRLKERRGRHKDCAETPKEENMTVSLTEIAKAKWHKPLSPTPQCYTTTLPSASTNSSSDISSIRLHTTIKP
jgi:hypothetical protein